MAYAKTGFTKSSKRYISPQTCRLEKIRWKEERFLSKTKNKRGKKKMLHEVESLLAVLLYQTIKTLLTFLRIHYLLTNHRNIKGKIKKFVSISPKNGTNIDLSVTSAFDPM